MHTMWKGSISFGLVTIPIKLFSATENKTVKMRQLHKECHNPIKYEKYCPVCEEEVEYNDLVKGYEYEPNKFVEVDKDDLKAIEGEQTKAIEIIDFVALKEIDPIYYSRSYFVGPGENGGKPYTLLKKAMEETEKIGIAKITIRSKQHLAVVRSYKNGLLLETMYFPDEVREIEHVPEIPENLETSEKELEMAKQLIEQLTTEFEPEKYNDDHREALLEMIQSKINGEEVKVSKEKPKENVVDLMDALQASINESGTKAKKATAEKAKATNETKKKKTRRTTTKKKKATS